MFMKSSVKRLKFLFLLLTLFSSYIYIYIYIKYTYIYKYHIDFEVWNMFGCFADGEGNKLHQQEEKEFELVLHNFL